MPKINMKTFLNKKSAAGAGGIGLILFLFYLQSIGYLEITGHSGDTNCAGSEKDSCLAYINFTAKKAFTKPAGPWLDVDNPIKSLRVEEYSKGAWKGIDPLRPMRFKAGPHVLRFVAFKFDPRDKIKWGFESIDPVWGEGLAEVTCDYQNITTEMPQWITEEYFDESNESYYNISVEVMKNISVISCIPGSDKITYADDELYIGNMGCLIAGDKLSCDAGPGSDGNGDSIYQSGETCYYYNLTDSIILDRIENGGVEMP